jgi:hypothetical protein
MKIREPYKGHVIEAMSSELRENLGFSTTLFIERHDSEGVTVTQFFVPGTFSSSDIAIRNAVVSGRRKIDTGYVPSI